ncbi:hypothetical protein ACFLJY_004768, partial [Vibrio alginolyticus]
MACVVNKSFLLGSILFALSGCGGDDSGLPEQGSLPEIPSSPTVPTDPEPVVPPIGVVPPTDPVDPEPVEPEPVTPPIGLVPELEPFNLLEINGANTSGEEAHVFRAEFIWDAAGNINEGDITYTVCEKDTSLNNSCLELGQVVNQTQMFVNLNAALRNVDKEYFVLASRKRNVEASSEKAISLEEINSIVGYFKSSNIDAGDGFGFASAMRSDGSMMAISSPGEDSNAQGVNGDEANNSVIDSGAVYIYEEE